MIPFPVLLIPNYIIANRLGVLNNLLALILPGMVSAFGIFLMRQFAAGIPRDLIEAARLDGASEWAIFGRIVLPLLRPALAALGVFTFLASWNDYLWPLVAITISTRAPCPWPLPYFNSVHATRYDLVMAAATMAVVPVLVVFLLFQRQIVKALVLAGMRKAARSCDGGVPGSVRGEMTMQAVLTEIDVEHYAREGYLTAPSVLTPDELAELREESDRVLALCAREPERYARRIQWETDHLASEDQRGMERVIRKLEPVSDLSPAFARYARHPGHRRSVARRSSTTMSQLFEDKLNLKLPGGSAYPWHQDWACCWRAHTDELITCFIYLDDADEPMGCLQVVPGSHLGKPICPFKPGSSFEIDPSCVDRRRSCRCRCRPEG